MQNVNTVVITGNLTQDPELRYLERSNEFVCRLRVAVSGRRKDPESGEWGDKPNYFDVAVWGTHAHTCANYLLKGRGIAVAGRLNWHEWEDKVGAKRQGVEIVARSVRSWAPRGGRPRRFERGWRLSLDPPIHPPLSEE